MHCFSHRDVSAIGLCKSCFKAVCSQCVQELKEGLACSEDCCLYVRESEEVMERAKRLYGIGHRKSKIPPTGLIIWFLFMTTMWISFLGTYLLKGQVESGTLVPAIIFTIIFGLAYFSSKRSGLQC